MRVEVVGTADEGEHLAVGRKGGLANRIGQLGQLDPLVAAERSGGAS